MKLRIHTPGQPTVEIEVHGDEVTVGRSSDCDVVISNPYVSKAHLRLVRGLVAVDLGSSNGTYLAGEKVEVPVLLTDGRIALGSEDVVLEVLEEGPQEDPNAPAQRELAARCAGLEHELEALRDEKEFLRLQTETLKKEAGQNDTRQKAAYAEIERLQRSYGELLKELQAEVGELLSEEPEPGS